MTKAPDISIVVPVYGCDTTLIKLHERISAAVSHIPAEFELILVDDCGPGHPWEVIRQIVNRDPRVIGLKLTRNFGQHNAIFAGLEFVKGNWLIIMDCDLQDRPEEIVRLWVKAHEGFEVVVGRRIERKDSFIKRMSSLAYHRFFGYMTDQTIDETQSSFGIYSRKVVDAVKNLPEQSRVFPLLVRWLGFPAVSIDITHDERAEGKSSYNLGRKLSLATDAIVSYSNKPLKMFIQTGFITASISICYGLWLIFRYLVFGQVAAGWTSVMVSLYFIFGILLFGMGVLGVYIGNIFNQVKERPSYVIKEYIRFPNEQLIQWRNEGLNSSD